MKETTRNLLSTLDDHGKDYTPNYRVWKKKEEHNLVGRIRSRISQMYHARQNSCYLTNFENSDSWDKHWDLLDKVHLMHAKFDDDDDFQSNLKSGIAWRTIRQIAARERKQEIAFLVEARNNQDKKEGRDITHRYLFQDYFRRNPDIRYKFFEVSDSAKEFGTGIAFIPYTVRMREVMTPKTPDIKKENVKKGEREKMEYKKEFRVDYEDVGFVPWRLQDFYVDPNAQHLHGTDYVATDCAGVLYVTPSQVRSMFRGDPDAMNLDFIDGDNRESFSSPYFKLPKDVEEGFCELIFYYNRETDSEIIICGDVLIKEGPNPYEDKEHPFVAFHVMKRPGHFYGMSITDSVLQLCSEDAAMKNARIMNIRMKIDAPVFMGATIFGDVDSQLDRIEPGQIIKVSDVNQTKVMDTPDIPFDSWRASEELKDEAVMNSGINPQGLTLPMASTPATNTLAMKETMADVVNMYVDDLMRGMNDWGKILESRFCQFYKLPTKKAALELNKKSFRELRLENIRLYEDDGQMKERDFRGEQIIPLDNKVFKWTETPKVYISPDFIAPISEAFQQRKAQEILPQLAPFAGEPGAEMKPGQPAVIHLRKLLGWYMDKMQIREEDLLIDEDEDRMAEIEQAQKQQKKMMDGEEVVGIPGEPLPHKYTHAIELMKINDTTQKPEFLSLLESEEPKARVFVEMMIEYKSALAEHLRMDSLIEKQAAEAAVTQSDAIDELIQQIKQQMQGGMPGQEGGMPMQQGMEGQMQGQPMGPEMPRNNAPNVPVVSGGMGLPNEGGVPVPNQMAPTDESGMGGY